MSEFKFDMDKDVKKIYKTCHKTSTIAGYIMMVTGFAFVVALAVARFVKYINLTEAQFLKEFWLLWLISVVFILGGAILLRHADNLNERLSSNGRTPGFGPGNEGSNPSERAKT